MKTKSAGRAKPTKTMGRRPLYGARMLQWPLSMPAALKEKIHRAADKLGEGYQATARKAIEAGLAHLLQEKK